MTIKPDELIAGKLYRVTVGYGQLLFGIFIKNCGEYKHLEFLTENKIQRLFGYKHKEVCYTEIK